MSGKGITLTLGGNASTSRVLLIRLWWSWSHRSVLPAGPNEARGHAQAAGGGARGTPAAGDRPAPSRPDLRRDRRAGGAEPDRGVRHLQALRRAGSGRTEDRPARARAGAWPLPRCRPGGGGPRPGPAPHARRAGPALRAVEPGGGARADPAAFRGAAGG